MRYQAFAPCIGLEGALVLRRRACRAWYTGHGLCRHHRLGHGDSEWRAP